MNLPAAILFGAVEGLTEFLPVSSTGHLTIFERLLGYQLDAADVTAFTAIIQTGAVLATVIYLRDEFRRIVFAIIRGMFRSGWRADPDWRFGWAVVLGSIPIGVVGLVFQDAIETTFRSLWFVAAALILWSLPMLYADRTATQKLGESEITWRDTLIIGLAQCLALVPGVSRSGATMTAGLLRGFDRVAVTRLSFMLSVPALTAAGILQAYTAADDISTGVGWPATIVATVVSFVVGYFSVAWLLRFVARHTFMLFIVYRIGLGLLLLLLLGVRAGLGDLTVAARGDVQVDLAHLRELRPQTGGDRVGGVLHLGRAELVVHVQPGRDEQHVRTEQHRPHVDDPVDLGVVGQLAADAVADRRRRGLADEHLLGVPAEQVGHHGQQHADRDRGRRVPERLPGQLVQAEPERGQQQADQRRGVLGEHGLHGRVGGQPDVLDHGATLPPGPPRAAAGPPSARTCPRPGTRRTAPRTTAGSRRPRTRRTAARARPRRWRTPRRRRRSRSRPAGTRRTAPCRTRTGGCRPAPSGTAAAR